MSCASLVRPCMPCSAMLRAQPFRAVRPCALAVVRIGTRGTTPAVPSRQQHCASAVLQRSSTSDLRRASVIARAGESDGQKPRYNTEFGYSRKDVFLIGAGLIGLGYAMYYGLQAMGMEAGYAGNWVQLIIFLGICVGWVSTYIWRVATKQMTYVKQLEAYEEAVMKKRVEEMTEAELSELAAEVEAERLRKLGQQPPKQQ